MRTSTRGRAAGLIALAIAAVALLPAAAQAHNPLDGGKTTLKLDKGTAKALSGLGVSVKPLRPAKAKGGSVTFPVTGGELSTDSTRGAIEHSGGLKFKAGGKSLAVKSFTIRLRGKSKLTAAVGNSRVPLLKLNTKKAKIVRQGLNTKISGVRASLTTAAARALNATFGVKVFKNGIPIGTTKTSAETKTVRLTGGDTALTLDPGTAAALTSLGISAAPVDPAAANPNGSLAFPITGGKLDSDTFAGKIRHSGGISLSNGATTVELTEFTIQIDGDPDLTAKVGGSRVSILNLDLSGLAAGVKKNGTISLENVSASLTQGAADALNGAFGTSAFTAGLTLGTTVTTAETG